ncbi:(deoxy)nucleoside triphosphate pyrophosphohydrolase [Mycoplasmatota bacterium]|nr:(deoxy)nucleoside triphosphate pyrophosphohydrolase [Mycoplasmatota bacterium]
MKTIEVVAAIIKKDHKFLCAQRPNDGRYLSLKWEFPGGKIEDNETPEDALRREIQEELELNISVKEFYFTVDHTYPDFRLIMHAYLCEMEEETFTLVEHNSIKWVSPSELMNLDWAEADLPIVHKILKK